MRRRFSIAEQQCFAELSGDSNPMHVDALAARRLMFGRPVVHGVHLVMWALEMAALEGIARLKAEFLRPIPIDTDVECLVSQTRIELHAAGLLCATLAVEPAPTPGTATLPSGFGPVECRVREWAELLTASGALGLGLDIAAAHALFPRAVKILSPLGAAELLATTRLVGMECPGSHSLYASFELVRRTQPAAEPLLRWRVTRADPRFRLLRMHVEGPLSTGTVDALVRPAPSEQLTLTEARRRVEPGEFAGQHALVVGGSRGLGEATAKLLAAGGAAVTLTYHSGRVEAQRLAAEIGGSALPFDVLDPGPLPEATHLYYFATPFIFERSGSAFDVVLFQRFCSYFVDGFARTVAGLPGVQRIFYPSTIALDQAVPGLAEYSAAKAAGEMLCRHLGAHIACKRLPRMRTDQTATVAKVSAEDPADVLLPILRELARC